jgi:hypothetical protein
MKTTKTLTDVALKHMIGHYGGMILLFLFKLSYIAFAITIGVIITEITGVGGIWGIILFSCICLLFYLLYQPLRICECNILYREIAQNSVSVSNLFSAYTDKHLRNRYYEITAEIFWRKAVVFFPIALTGGIIIYFTIQTLDVFDSVFLSVIIVLSAALTAVSLILLYIVYSIKYIAVYYISTVFSEMNVKDVIVFSDRITKGNKNFIIKVILRVTPFYIITLLIFPAMFSIPYIDTVKALLVKELIENYEKPVI